MRDAQCATRQTRPEAIAAIWRIAHCALLATT